MAAITVKQFGSSQPRMADHLLSGASASVAMDCKLWHGTLQSWREPKEIRDVEDGTKTVAMYGCCWMDFPACVDIAYGPTTCRRIYTTGDQEWPAVVAFDDETCEPTIRRLGVPCGDTMPSIVLGALNSTAPKDTEGRSYAYQYRNSQGERGSLSKATAAQLVRDGQTVIVSGWDVPDPSWDVTDVLIYRTVSGHQSGRETGNLFDTTWMLVGIAPIDAISFVDSFYNDVLQQALEEDVAPPPPAALRGIVWIESMNSMAGYVGNRLYFSENNSYHQWPYHIDLDDNICGLVENAGTLYVATDGHPYAVAGAVDCKNAGCRQAIRLGVKFPMTGCGNRRMARAGGGAVYPTHTGLVWLNGRSEPTLLTEPLYAADDWQLLIPESVTPIEFNGKLFVFARRGAFVLTIPNGPAAGWPLDTHSELSDRDVVDGFVTRTGDLYLLKGTTVVQWDRGATLRPHRWKSPEYVTPAPIGLGAAHLHHGQGAESVTIHVDGRQVFTRPVFAPKAFRLPTWAYGTRWYFTLEGTANVSLFSMATSMKELGA